ncbi:unnamed protein product [Polarella glacialis]|uniref:Uncharacterized protein n=1 Tax=Polarella glacialis TaxID=89957 RepID=A0A813HP59_POLGL|nr:unnamed protein product [Polarella glacialis]
MSSRSQVQEGGEELRFWLASERAASQSLRRRELSLLGGKEEKSFPSYPCPFRTEVDSLHVGASCTSLRDVIVDEVAQAEQAEEELRSRESEKWQLLQLLSCKDECIVRQKLAGSQLQAVAPWSKSCAQHYLLLCCVRCWRDLAERAVSRRRLLESKERLVAASLRHACGLLCSGLRQASGRRLAEATHQLWLHAAVDQGLFSASPPPFQSPLQLAVGTGSSGAFLERTSEGAPDQPPSMRLPALPYQRAEAAEPQAAEPQAAEPQAAEPQAAELQALQRGPAEPSATWFGAAVTKGSSSLVDQPHDRLLDPDDQVLFATPRKASAGRQSGSSSSCFATQSAKSPIPAFPSPVVKSTQVCRSPFSEASTRATSSSMSALVPYTCGFTDHGRNSLATCIGGARLGIALQTSCLRHLAWGMHRLHTSAATLSEVRPLLDEGRAISVTPKAAEVTKLSLRRVERLCSKLEASLSSEAAWRKEAEKRILAMASRGEKLERERAQLLRRCEEAHHRLATQEEQEKHLQVAVRRSEDAAEVLNQKTQSLEARSTEHVSCMQKERHGRQGGALHQDRALSQARGEVLHLRLALQAATVAATATATAASTSEKAECSQWEAQGVAQATQRNKNNNNSNNDVAELQVAELQVAWQRERDQWAEACGELQARLAGAVGEAAVARHAQEETEAAASSARADSASLQSEAKRELRTEVQVYEELQAQLESRLERTSAVCCELKAEAAEASAPARDSNWLQAHDSVGFKSEASLPELDDEAEAYKTLLARLRAELRWEQAERTACDKSLDSLRGSYSLLLSRLTRPVNGIDVTLSSDYQG